MKVDAKMRERLNAALFYGILAFLAYFVFRIIEPFAAPLAWAAVLVVVAHPVYARLEKRLGATRAALASTLGVTLVLIVPTLAAMYAFARQGILAVREMQAAAASGHFAWVNHAWADLQARFPETSAGDLPDTLRGYAETGAGYLAGQMGTILAHAALFCFDLSVTILVMFYLFRDSRAIVARLRDLLPFEPEQRERMLVETEELIHATVISTLAAAVAQGVLGGIAFAATGIAAPIFWGVMVAFFSLVPVIGSALIWVPAVVGLLAGGHIGRGIALAAVFALIIALVDNVIRPWLISGRAEMSGLVVFISVLGGVNVFGPLGAVLGPIVVALAASLLDFYLPSAHRGNKPAQAHGK